MFCVCCSYICLCMYLHTVHVQLCCVCPWLCNTCSGVSSCVSLYDVLHVCRWVHTVLPPPTPYPSPHFPSLPRSGRWSCASSTPSSSCRQERWWLVALAGVVGWAMGMSMLPWYVSKLGSANEVLSLASTWRPEWSSWWMFAEWTSHYLVWIRKPLTWHTHESGSLMPNDLETKTHYSPEVHYPYCMCMCIYVVCTYVHIYIICMYIYIVCMYVYM